MSSNSKVYHQGRNGFRLPIGSLDAGKEEYRDASRLPTLYWPNERWCVEANMFLLDLLGKTLSRSGRGGTVLVYAAHIGHLIKYCFRNQVPFHELSDNQFSHFIRGLNVNYSRDAAYSRSRSGTTIIQIGRTCIRFLVFIGDLYDLPNFLGPTGSIRAQKTIFAGGYRKRAGQSSAPKLTWTHSSFPLSSPQKRGMPISRDDIEKLKRAVLSISGSNFLVKRRLVMILVFEITGARRSEVALLKTSSVVNALRAGAPLLTMVTVKKGGNQFGERKIPVARVDLEFIQEFVEKNRARIVRRTVGRANDDGFVFVGERTGRGLTSDYLGHEFWKLRRAAGIETRVHAHSFRHRFITKMFIQMVKMHEYNNADDFRRALLSTSSLRKKLMAWTGHRNLDSLDHYIDLAFDELSGFDKTMEGLVNLRSISAVAGQVDMVAENLLSGGDEQEAVRRLKSLAASLKEAVGEADQTD